MIKLSPKNEFYVLLDTTKEIYSSGIVVGKTIYTMLQEQRNIQMSYQRFNEYFRLEFPRKKTPQTNYDASDTKVAMLTEPEAVRDPKILVVGERKKHGFSACRKIDPKDIL